MSYDQCIILCNTCSCWNRVHIICIYCDGLNLQLLDANSSNVVCPNAQSFTSKVKAQCTQQNHKIRIILFKPTYLQFPCMTASCTMHRSGIPSSIRLHTQLMHACVNNILYYLYMSTLPVYLTCIIIIGLYVHMDIVHGPVQYKYESLISNWQHNFQACISTCTTFVSLISSTVTCACHQLQGDWSEPACSSMYSIRSYIRDTHADAEGLKV